MTVEERLKELIIEKYGTMKDFTDYIGIPNSTFANILRRGVKNANVVTIIKICQALGISTDDLAEGKIVPIGRKIIAPTKVEDIIENTKRELMNGDNLTLGDHQLTESDVYGIVLLLDMMIEVEHKRLKKKDEEE